VRCMFSVRMNERGPKCTIPKELQTKSEYYNPKDQSPSFVDLLDEKRETDISLRKTSFQIW